MEQGFFFNFEKFAYIKGAKPEGCILCGIRDQRADVINLSFAESRHFIACINMYPFNPGHMLVFPKRHLLDIRDFTANEANDFHTTSCALLDALKTVYEPAGFNIGFNMGSAAGGSIAHLHQHIIPRWQREIGMAELIGGHRVTVEDPRTSARRLQQAIREQGILQALELPIQPEPSANT